MSSHSTDKTIAIGYDGSPSEDFLQRIHHFRQGGQCAYCSHFHRRLIEHEQICKDLSLCPDTRRVYRVRTRFFSDRQSWGVYKKSVCLTCYSTKYCQLRLNLEPLQRKPAICEDCSKDADAYVSIATSPYSTIVDFEIFPPSGKGIVNVPAGLAKTKAEFIQRLRVDNQ